MSKMTPRRKAQLILELAMKINDTPTKQELTANKPTVFAWFSGHVNLFNVEIHLDGWFCNSDPDYAYHIYFSDNESVDDKLDECISVLKDIWHKYRPVHIEETAQAEEVAV